MYMKIFISKNWFMQLWDLAGWMEWERQARRLEPQAEAYPAILRQNLFFLQEASSFAQAFGWLDEATTVLSGSLYWSSDDGCEPHPQNTFTATSRQVFGWIIGHWPAQPDTDSWPSQYLSNVFFLEKIPYICTMITAFGVYLCLLWNTLSVGATKWSLSVLCTW